MTEIPVPHLPHMEPEGLARFQTALAQSRCYLEFGSGGSTVLACRTPGLNHIVTVETDPAWLQRVQQATDGSPCDRSLLHCDLGPVGPWGTPLSRDHAADFWRYPTLPWQTARARGLHPDLVLIDGRFRVACFLHSLISADAGTTVLFDDYFDRAHYAVAEKFCQPCERHGRLAVFRVDAPANGPLITETLLEYSTVWH